MLVHNLYGQAAPSSRSHIRLAMLGLAWLWGYDLNLYTLAYLGAPSAAGLVEWRGVAVALTAPLFALGARDESGWRIRLSRAATFQSLSLLAICAYFALMAIVATALRGSGFDWSGALMIGVLAVMTVGAMAVIPSARARGWLKVKLAKHLFEHRYDYRTEWLRFTGTLGRAGPDAAPLERAHRQGIRRCRRCARRHAAGQRGRARAGGGGDMELAVDGAPGRPARGLRGVLDRDRSERANSRIRGTAQRLGENRRQGASVPAWMIADETVWAGVPLIHNERMVGLVILAAPEFRRALDWEDFDLLRTAGNQAASSLAEAFGQEALANAQRFEEFNRRFAFILHDIKNLVSQLSLLSRNAERHADNPEFRADMVATLQSSVGKMRDLLARLAPHSPAAVQRVEPQPLLPILSSAIAAKRREREVTLLGDAGQWARSMPERSNRRSAICSRTHSRRAATAAGDGAGERGRAERHRRDYRPRQRHGRRLRPQQPVPALCFDQGRRVRHRCVRSPLPGRRDGWPGQRRQPPRQGYHLHHPPPGRRAGRTNHQEKRMTSQSESKVLLVVEDDEGLQRQLKWAYEGYAVVCAGDRAAAIEALRAHEPAVVTLDLGLPPDPDGTDEGFATLAEILAPQARYQGHRRDRPRRPGKRAQGDRDGRL